MEDIDSDIVPNFLDSILSTIRNQYLREKLNLVINTIILLNVSIILVLK